MRHPLLYISLEYRFAGRLTDAQQKRDRYVTDDKRRDRRETNVGIDVSLYTPMIGGISFLFEEYEIQQNTKEWDMGSGKHREGETQKMGYIRSGILRGTHTEWGAQEM